MDINHLGFFFNRNWIKYFFKLWCIWNIHSQRFYFRPNLVQLKKIKFSTLNSRFKVCWSFGGSNEQCVFNTPHLVYGVCFIVYIAVFVSNLEYTVFFPPHVMRTTIVTLNLYDVAITFLIDNAFKTTRTRCTKSSRVFVVQTCPSLFYQL